VLVDSDSALPKDQERAAGASSIGAGSGSQSQASTAANRPMGSNPTRGQRSLALFQASAMGEPQHSGLSRGTAVVLLLVVG